MRALRRRMMATARLYNIRECDNDSVVLLARAVELHIRNVLVLVRVPPRRALPPPSAHSLPDDLLPPPSAVDARKVGWHAGPLSMRSLAAAPYSQQTRLGAPLATLAPASFPFTATSSQSSASSVSAAARRAVRALPSLAGNALVLPPPPRPFGHTASSADSRYRITVDDIRRLVDNVPQIVAEDALVARERARLAAVGTLPVYTSL